MSKTVRIVLYVLSILTVAGLFAAFVFAGNKTSETDGKAATAENGTGQSPEGSGESKGPDPGNAVAGTEGLKETEETEGTEEIKETEKMKEDPDMETKGGDTTILFAGDVLFANAFKAGYDAKGIQGVLEDALLNELLDADILMVNNEFPFSDRGAPMENKQFTFRCSPSYVKALGEMGVDVVSLANNHTLDYGKEALLDTFAALDGAGILYGGAGDSVERAEEVQVIEANGWKFGFLAVSRVIPETGWKVENSTPGIFSCYDETRLLELIKEAKQECDFLAVYPHWGVEYSETPESYQTRIAEKCVEAGADMIVGSHTHCLQGVEMIGGKPVFYSLGNFIFGREIDRSAVVKVTVSETGECTYEMLPVKAAGGVTGFAEGAVAEGILNYIDSISPAAHVGTDGVVKEAAKEGS